MDWLKTMLSVVRESRGSVAMFLAFIISVYINVPLQAEYPGRSGTALAHDARDQR